MEFYEVGGCVRDEIMGHTSSDIDFTVVLSPEDMEGELIPTSLVGTDDGAFGHMVQNLEALGFNVFVTTPNFLVAKAKFPGAGTETDHSDFDRPYDKYKGLVADFVLARKEGDYSDGRRPDAVEVGTLEDDLARRDFTMNAIAKDSNGSLIDLYNGQKDIQDRIIRTVGDPVARFEEDALRAVRALRFSVTKRMNIAMDVQFAMQDSQILDAIRDKISDDRIRAELSKMFRYDTPGSIRTMSLYPLLTDALFSGSVSLDTTMKTKGRGQ